MPKVFEGLKSRTCPRVGSCHHRTQIFRPVRRGATPYVAKVDEAAERGSLWGIKYMRHRVKNKSMALDMRNGTFALEDTYVHGCLVDAKKKKKPTKVHMPTNTSHPRCPSGRLPYNRKFLPRKATKQAPGSIAETRSRVRVHAGATGHV